jgi:hypothetical protein
VEILCREYGLFVLPGKRESYGGGRLYLPELANFLLQEQDPEKALDAIELSFKYIDRMTTDWHHRHIDNYDEVADNANR